MSTPTSPLIDLRLLSSPELQVLAALVALGEDRSRAALLALLAGGPGAGHEETVDTLLGRLGEAGLVRRGEGDRLEIPPSVVEAFPRPLGLGPPARLLWREQTADRITAAIRALGSRPEGRKEQKLEALLALLGDTRLIRTRLERAPSAVAEALHESVAEPDEDDVDRYAYGLVDQEAYRRERAAVEWATAAGLCPPAYWGYRGLQLPAEVGLVLRGAGYRAPFTPVPPPIAVRDITVEAVSSAASAAIGGFLGRVLALLDGLVGHPVPELAGGGVGVRELGRLTKRLGGDAIEVRLALALAGERGLLAGGATGLGPSQRAADWRALEPARQAADLLGAWWGHPGAATQAIDEDGKALPVARRGQLCTGCQAARTSLMSIAAALPDGLAADLPHLAAAARWTLPNLHVLPQDAEAPLATPWREAELLGVVAAGAVSDLGRALKAGEAAELLGHLRRMLPPPSDTARFGSDLTALVAGTPSARASLLLDRCADRESSGGAVTWRFNPASVRRALDAGATPAGLLGELTGLAGVDLPQPLEYLIRDVARRHGHLCVRPAVALIRSDDEALLAEVVADRRLAKLGLTLVAPTFAACAVPVDKALARLREVGYFPIAEEQARA